MFNHSSPIAPQNDGMRPENQEEIDEDMSDNVHRRTSMYEQQHQNLDRSDITR
jgi:hypothetical protein